ncbi:CPBP family intramembrane glutamic endopeptidase [Geomicrobium sp. JCM 19055]|uniref:CPBP family intramembrane glutamic endopeptidase n=1 Tax=Geomicrobium sp. JCM 19055 TaxID=1460649 RepID=UPI00045ECCBC|nr:CPBP family intramembrane glutamic endopeptidase [Geomicrobium sp. JCM 19055]GAJ97765.1 hypothetical protein JCM19055_642 [Geomicrobium sp. JCM 19055]
MASRAKTTWILLSPIIIIAIGFVVATLFSSFMNEWAWVPLAIVYWSLLGYCIYRFKGNKQVKSWLGKSRPSKGIVSLGWVVGLFPFTVLLMNLHVLNDPWIIGLWLLFAMINPVFEELYWRGLLLDAAMKRFPNWASIAYTTVFFVLSHPLMWGVFSIANQHIHVLLYLPILGIVWSLIYIKTGSLRFAIASHALVNIGILTVPVFLNLYIPPV